MDEAERIVELEAELRQRDDKIKELRAELAEAQELVDQMRERTDDQLRVIDNWIEVFDMQQNDAGTWIFDETQSGLWEEHMKLWEQHQKMVRQWNRTVAQFNAIIRPRPTGRPLGASDSQVAEVRKRHKAGDSLRAIARATRLGISTVRTIIEKAEQKGRAGKRTNDFRRLEFDRQRAAAYRVRKKARDALPPQITELQKIGDSLVKAAKGLGR